MISLFHSRRFSGSLPACHLLCLLLVLTFLYNPFLGASSLAPYPSVSHPPSFRATIASSELLKFKPEEQTETPAVQACEFVIFSAVALMGLERSSHLPFLEVPQFSQDVPLGNLWFRPPPVA